MASERLSISLNPKQAAKVRKLVKLGAYPSISAAFGRAVDVLEDLAAEEKAWWGETKRRCEEAIRNPERMLEHDVFWKQVHERKEKTRKELQRHDRVK